ncbi:DUF484 domain-containing protein [Stutzerimonas nosocomialis]|uniref:DUF484 domain-containing protein n=1 Tax=Stutzerimonas nosocomialis TaxID=1056496 RepID=A0A5R9QHY0_9GAMM|nr:DUF484 family protein [Stutzerimonas nosocomialis]TLX58717.1 DUF484 domain-containing protein [Stutzerimonas nosocomialis]TLX58835.1 DUF484 domain-containing protein [Stutzerimonas nosocomialis]TLX64831.1 DUF484 domain-containing protein [Stutzerimonas nosocomialis]
MTDQRQDPPEQLDPEQVAAFLRAHPEFFVDYDELIAELRIPHARGDAVSLVERQVKLLRERNIEMRHRLSQLMDVARDNDRLFDKTRRLVLDLLDASSLEEIVGAVDDSLRHEFQVPFVSLILFSETPIPVGRSVTAAEAHQAIGGLLGDGKTTCGVLRPHELAYLFGEQESAGIGSAAVVSLTQQGVQQGILAIGSPDPQHYKSSLGTLFLGYVAEVLIRVLPRFSTPLRSVR